jgi:hypothetical protein
VRVFVVIGLLLFTTVVVLLSRRGAGRRVQLRSCCSAQRWPPDDLTNRDG